MIDKSLITVNIENTNQKISYGDFEKLEPKPKGYFWINYQNRDSILFNYNLYIKTDTFYFQSRNQTLEETTITANVLRQESHDTMHVVDFHFVEGILYTIQKSVNSIKNKYLFVGGRYNLINSRANLLYDDLMGFPLFEIKDSIFIYDNGKLDFLMTNNDYRKKFYGYIGTINDVSYYKNTFFYNLIDEISKYDAKNKTESCVDIFYDSSSFYFISQRYQNVNPPKGVPATYMYYASHHKKAGKYFFNENKFSVSKLSAQNSQIFKSLQFSDGFLEMLDIMEESRMDAYLFDSMLVVLNFNKSEINYYVKNKKIDSKKIELHDLWYRNEFYTDEERKKGYFLFRKGNTQIIIEIDYLTAETNAIPLLNGIHGLYHWEVNDGRLYILKKEYPTSWKRILYSYNINDIRIN